MENNEITSLEFGALEHYLPHINYNDGDIAIIDSLQDLSAIATIRMGIHAVLLCEKGQIQLDVNGRPLMVSEDDIIFCPASGIIDNILVSSDFECKILCLTDNILRSFVLANVQLLHRVLYAESISVLPLDKNAKQRFLSFYTIAQYEMSDTTHPFHKEMMQSLVRSFLFLICGYYMKSLPIIESVPTSHSEKLFQQFLNLLSREPVKRHTVNYFAQKMCITPKYLTIICNKISHRTASGWIREYTLNEIHYYLRNTDKTIKEIAFILDFPSVQSFGKYVRLNMGISPKDYRKRFGIKES